jgi:hypothetical protein
MLYNTKHILGSVPGSLLGLKFQSIPGRRLLSLMDPWVELTGHRHPPGAPPEKPRLRIQVVNERSAKKQK